jgi:hypothetical protein
MMHKMSSRYKLHQMLFMLFIFGCCLFMLFMLSISCAKC